jgi:hypothetical protein
MPGEPELGLRRIAMVTGLIGGRREISGRIARLIEQVRLHRTTPNGAYCPAL